MRWRVSVEGLGEREDTDRAATRANHEDVTQTGEGLSEGSIVGAVATSCEPTKRVRLSSPLIRPVHLALRHDGDWRTGVGGEVDSKLVCVFGNWFLDHGFNRVVLGRYWTMPSRIEDISLTASPRINKQTRTRSTSITSESPLIFLPPDFHFHSLPSGSKALVAGVPSTDVKSWRRVPSDFHFGDDALLKTLPNRQGADFERGGVEVSEEGN